MTNMELMLGDEVINVPNEITLGIYQELNRFPEKYKQSINIISAFTGITVRELKNMPMESIKLVEAFLTDKMVIPDKTELVMTFEHDGVLYGLENDWSKLAFGGWVDFEVYSSDNIYENLHKIMAILYRPVVWQDKKNPLKYKIKPYLSEEIDDRAEIMRYVPVRFWLGASTFFLQIVEIYITSIKDSLTLMMKRQEMTMRGWKILPKFIRKRLPLDSILPSFTDSQKKMLQNLTM